MKRHRRFEFLAGEYLKKEGYEVEVTQGVADWGVDVFAKKDGIRIAVQAKMYGDCKTSITRRMMMELYGVMHYFDCQKSMMIYNGRIMPDALQVAEKLGIQLVYLDQHRLDQLLPEVSLEETADTFNTLWQEIRQLEGKTIANNRGTSYNILKVTDGDITYTHQPLSPQSFHLAIPAKLQQILIPLDLEYLNENIYNHHFEQNHSD